MGALSSVINFLFKCFAKHNQRGRKGSCVLFVYCFLFLVYSIVLVDAAPHRSKSKGRDGPQTVYDQKQTGDYNIQLHLKDFQIIALLGDDSLGDYDYSYDYADFTVKPSGGSSTSTTLKPSSTTQPSSTTAKSPSSTNQFSLNPSTIKPNSSNTPLESSIPDASNINANAKPASTVVSNVHPYPIEVVVFEPTKKPVVVEKNPNKEELNINNNKDIALESALNEILSSSSSSSPQSSTDALPISTRLPSKNSSPTPDAITAGKIKVQILEAPSPTVEIAAASVGIVPGEDVQAEVSGAVLHGELASYRKCASGFSRDKKGRCRRVRRPGISPQLPFGFGRIASNLATRLRLPSQDNPVDTPVLPTEN